ncbi:alpha/beta hydrolase [Phanerochaete sordida]|uniref:Alpha/beta hydrolase n=1 Tax=Phanerochaete sordida TaxID=48140 RepID=A0A9P3G3Q6_9APHY|nr:alpha/beta hydrolase [Phanerochaete sordida]
MPDQTLATRARGLLGRISKLALYLGLFYLALLSLLTIPAVQRHAAFQHGVRLPLFANFDAPEKYGLAPGKALNVHFSTPDNCTLGAWFVLADPYYWNLKVSSSERSSPPTENLAIEAIQAHPTILYLHGAGGSRAIPWFVGAYLGFASRLHTNVFAIDYRGFADSTGTPDSDGLALDAYTAWQWLVQRGAKPEDIVLVGHSLGTGVAGRLMTRLAAEGVAPRGVALLAPFSSFSKLIETYALFRTPILWPVQRLPWGLRLLKRLIRHEFDTLKAVEGFHAPTLIAHAQDDPLITTLHSKTLIDAMLEPLLSADEQHPTSTPTPEELLAHRQLQEERGGKCGEIVQTTVVPNFGVIEEFKGLRAPVVYVETFWGSHSYIGIQEGIQDEMARLFHLGRYRK